MHGKSLLERYLRSVVALSSPVSVLARLDVPALAGQHSDARLIRLLELGADPGGELLRVLTRREAEALLLVEFGRAELHLDEGAVGGSDTVARALSHEDCARLLGITLSALRGRLRSARNKIKAAIRASSK